MSIYYIVAWFRVFQPYFDNFRSAKSRNWATTWWFTCPHIALCYFESRSHGTTVSPELFWFYQPLWQILLNPSEKHFRAIFLAIFLQIAAFNIIEHYCALLLTLVARHMIQFCYGNQSNRAHMPICVIPYGMPFIALWYINIAMRSMRLATQGVTKHCRDVFVAFLYIRKVKSFVQNIPVSSKCDLLQWILFLHISHLSRTIPRVSRRK